jgi:phospholipid/cholesterol/gamma-HCH transport system substrate-binding protein
LFIDLDQDSKVAGAPQALARGHRFPIIRSTRSDFDQLLSSLPALANRMIDLVDHFNQVFSDENARAITQTLENARLASRNLPATVHDAEMLVAEMRNASREVAAVALDLHDITRKSAPDIEAALANTRHITDRLADTADHLDRFVAENEPSLSRFTSQSLPEFEQLLREGREAARDFRDLSRSLKQNPSQLLYESNYRGVEVPR